MVQLQTFSVTGEPCPHCRHGGVFTEKGKSVCHVCGYIILHATGIKALKRKPFFLVQINSNAIKETEFYVVLPTSTFILQTLNVVVIWRLKNLK